MAQQSMKTGNRTLSNHDIVGWATAEAAMGALVIGMLITFIIAVALYTPPSVLEAAQREADTAQEKSDLQQQLNDLEKRLEKSQQAAEASATAAQLAKATEQNFRQDLLGLQGSMASTLILVDISSSVGQQTADGTSRPNWGGDGTPWGFIRNQVSTWVKYLPIEHYRIIAFNSELKEFPAESRWANRGDDLASTTAFLDALKPDGITKTEQALRRAVLWKPTNIVLITDGAPSNDEGEFDEEQVKRILAFVESDQFNIPVNVVAVNNYFEQRFGTFLHRLAAKSGGSFIGL